MVKLNILITGVGGQGVVLASDILGDVALESGLDVKKTDTLGMAQRGGSVVTHLRIGETVASPLIGEGEVDLLLAFEKLEAARWSAFLKPGSTVVVNDQAIPPLAVSLGGDEYPDDEEIVHILSHKADGVLPVEGSRIAAEMGNGKVLNVLMLGALSLLTPFNPETWQSVLRRRLPPKILDINLAAFERGRLEMTSLLSALSGESGEAGDCHDDDCSCGC
jgi:indolepyruvate ferredoxin oxidoreductase, beta subunit